MFCRAVVADEPRKRGFNILIAPAQFIIIRIGEERFTLFIIRCVSSNECARKKGQLFAGLCVCQVRNGLCKACWTGVVKMRIT